MPSGDLPLCPRCGGYQWSMGGTCYHPIESWTPWMATTPPDEAAPEWDEAEEAHIELDLWGVPRATEKNEELTLQGRIQTAFEARRTPDPSPDFREPAPTWYERILDDS